ncbi:DUF2274 domain-containing protein [Burkholderia multivorans]|jgi:hypothetical protein|uniref:DUF2274 domain-containing protein n=1 Tax=Burkholderia multivorans TaxID=87883 RepID=UPI001C214FAE|nr:DUF2274 domain-containing protein [Burkholderia multivorans]MBU9199935.1 DUF2274 domain-containing protein [Burkholderia multivorans]MDN8078946.1 DUF2274 domain-containing protein [Burkholderia multivorans]
MKLSRIPGHEQTVKHSFAFKQSTSSLLQQYQAMYEEELRAEVTLKDIVEQMLLDFMADDKVFQKRLRAKQESASAPGVSAAGKGGKPVAGQASPPPAAAGGSEPSNSESLGV